MLRISDVLKAMGIPKSHYIIELCDLETADDQPTSHSPHLRNS